MKSDGRFTRMSLDEFPGWLKKQAAGRKIGLIQQHHTNIPAYQHFTGDNHFDLLAGMRRAHLERGFADIAQHFTTFPDGMIGTGRPLISIPAGIKGANAEAICIENLGNFDAGKDAMKPAQRDAIVGLTAALARAFALTADTDHVVYHHWYDLDTGRRTGGTGNTKSCPGTSFFGGNRVADCRANFLPRVQTLLDSPADRPPKPVAALKAGEVTADSLNVRKGPSAKDAVLYSLACGAPVACYETRASWWRIHPTKQQWLNAKYVENT